MRSILWFVVAGLFFTAVDAPAQSPNGSMIIAEEFAAANTYSGPLPGFFASWCADTATSCSSVEPNVSSSAEQESTATRAGRTRRA
jgi:hypothetical protein